MALSRIQTSSTSFQSLLPLAPSSEPASAALPSGRGRASGDAFTGAAPAVLALNPPAEPVVLPSMSLSEIAATGDDRAAWEADIRDGFRSMLLRDPEPQELDSWMETFQRLADGGFPSGSLKGFVVLSLGITRESQVIRSVNAAMQELLGQTPTARGPYHQQALQMLEAGASVQDIDTAIRSGITDSRDYALAHVDEMCQGLFRELLGRDGGIGDWWNAQCRQRIDQGQTLAQVKDWMRRGIEDGPEYFQKHVDEICAQIFQEVLGRPGSDKPTDYWNQVARQKLAEGMPPAQIKAFLRDAHMNSDEYGLNHLDYVVNKLYQQLLNRDADAGGRDFFVGLAGQMKAEGRSLSDIRGAISEKIRASDEYRRSHGVDVSTLGSLSAKYESNGRPGAVSGGQGDVGGVSYGAYQFSSRTGGINAFLRFVRNAYPDYYNALADKVPGSAEFSRTWVDIANREPARFLQAQHDAIANEYYLPARGLVERALGIDLGTRSKALNDVLWSTATQHGQGGAENIFVRAIAGRNASQMTDEDIIRAVYAERGRKDANGVLVYFAGNSFEVQQGVAARFRSELQDALNMLRAEGRR